jgi:protein TonB
MAKNHAPSLLFSVIVHVLAGLAFYLTYQAVTSLTKQKQKETLMCVSLSTYIPKQIKKEPVKKISHKTVPKKKKVPQKIVKNIKPKVIKKTVPIINATIKTPQIIKETIVTFIPIKKEEVKSSPKIVQTKEINTTVKTKTVSPHKRYVDNHLQKIQELLRDNLYYPRRARKRGIIGTVMVHFEIDTNGKVRQVKTLASPSEILSRAAVKTIEDLSGKFPKPSENLFLKIPIVYKLNN